MAIKFGMTLAEMIVQLTKGFRKATGRNPDGLEKVKIQQEAVQRFKDMNKVVDMEGNVLDPSKPIMGGTQEGAALRSGIMRATGTGPKKVVTKGLPDKEFQDLRRSFRMNIVKNSPDFNQDLADRIIKREIYQDLSDTQRKDFLDNLDFVLKNPRDGNADGGRIGFKKGMDRRTFMKIMGGLTALPVLGKFFKGAEVAAPAVEKAVDVASGAPPYFFNLVNKIRTLGKKFSGPKERSESYVYKDYEMDIDLDTGAIDIKKTKEAMIPGGDEAGIAEEVIMTYKPGMADETTKGKKVVDEYDEYTARPDMDGKMKDVEDGVPDEVIEEGTVFEDNMTEFGKASGGIARMLGE